MGKDWLLILCAGLQLLVPAYVSGGLSQDYLDQISRSSADVTKIKQLILQDARKGMAYKRLAELSDKFPQRISGSDMLEDSIDHIMEEMRNESFSNVHAENVTVPKWTRGENEYAIIVTPMYRRIAILALGTSVNTTNAAGDNLTAEVIVVKDFDELEAKGVAMVSNKIVVYNQKWVDYGTTNEYRTNGATRAARLGAVGALVRSVTDFSLYTPHTGVQDYNTTGGVPKIPVACITVEDAELLQRYQDRGQPITILMHLESQNYDDVISRNIVAEIPGTDHPEQVVIFGGHIDTWDVGGPMDDGGGVMIGWEALSVMKKLDLKPKRTLRLVLWTSEEFGLYGGQEYYNANKNESENVSLIMESDHGVFNPRGLKFSGCGLARAILEEILKMTNDINTTSVHDGGGQSSDTGWWHDEKGVPAAELYSYSENYFWYHHTNADAMTMMNPDVLDRATALWATAIYAVGMLDDILPRTGDYPPSAASSIAPAVPALLLGMASILIKNWL